MPNGLDYMRQPIAHGILHNSYQTAGMKCPPEVLQVSGGKGILEESLPVGKTPNSAALHCQ